uniref:Dysferlin-interacting protein 1 n=2 Tax=Caligus TaxID=217164 RepID=C1C0P9_CALCM|nr:Dysferlin-interacting protein 1 [Caligus clemensi]
MSRRASVFAKKNPGKPRVRFPDEVIFENEIKEQDGEAVMSMLRRASIDIDINRINSAGLTALHQAVLDNNLPVVKILLNHGSKINMQDADSWTPLHAACANGLYDISKVLLDRGARTSILTDRKERPIDLVDPGDSKMLAVMLAPLEKKR